MDKSENVLKWYPFKKDSLVLEIYKDESLLNRINASFKLESINLDDISKLDIDKKYDYITLIGTYEYAPKFIGGDKPYSNLLKNLKKCLNEDGRILIAVNNRLGVKYLVGAKNEHYDNIFEMTESEIRKQKPNLLLKSEIEKYIDEAGIKYYKFYYPLNDYKFTNVIFTDEYLPKSSNSKLIYPINYEQGSIVIHNEINTIKQICENNSFINFTNSFLIELSESKIDNDIKFVNYNIFRKDKYQLILKMKKDIVEKIPATNEAKEHVKDIEKYLKKLRELGFEILEEIIDEKIVSKIIKEEELDKKIVRLIKENCLEEAYGEIEQYYNFIKERLEKEKINGLNIFEKYGINVEKEKLEKLTFIKDGFIDLSFENVFCKNGYLFYDQEWYFENIPIEFILYRAIVNLYAYNQTKIEPKIKKEKMLKRFGLLEYVEIFEILEKEIQREILNEERAKTYRDEIQKRVFNIEDMKKDYKYIEEINREYLILKEIKESIEKELKEVSEKYIELNREYTTSRGWKIIKKLRKFKRKA